MAAPKKTYFITVIPGGRPLKYREKGGGHFKTGFNSADRFAKIEPGKTYDIDYYGWRFGLFSMFPKIESVS